jgi:hypothetical protein
MLAFYYASINRQDACTEKGRMNRLATGFSKKLENHGHMVALYFMHLQLCRVHKTLRVTPAMEAGLTDHVWEMEEMLFAFRVVGFRENCTTTQHTLNMKVEDSSARYGHCRST